MTTPEKCARCGQVHPGCTSHTKNGPNTGQPCRRRCAPGEVCPSHGGSAPQVRAARARRRDKAAAAKAVATLGLPLDITPTDALLEEVRWTAGHVHWLRAKVQDLGELNTGDTTGHSLVWGETKSVTKGAGQWPGTDTTQSAGPSVWYQLYAKEREHLIAVASAALRAGVEERRVRLAEQQGDLVATVIRRILDSLNLTPTQLELVPVVVPRELRLIAGGA